jgi:hypothetical protein
MSETTVRAAKTTMTTLAGVERLLEDCAPPLLGEEEPPLALAEVAPFEAPFLCTLLLGFFDMPEKSLRVDLRPTNRELARPSRTTPQAAPFVTL